MNHPVHRPLYRKQITITRHGLLIVRRTLVRLNDNASMRQRIKLIKMVECEINILIHTIKCRLRKTGLPLYKFVHRLRTTKSMNENNRSLQAEFRININD